MKRIILKLCLIALIVYAGITISTAIENSEGYKIGLDETTDHKK